RRVESVTRILRRQPTQRKIEVQYRRHRLGHVDQAFVHAGRTQPDRSAFGDSRVDNPIQPSRDDGPTAADINADLDIRLRAIPSDRTAVAAKLRRKIRPTPRGG